MAIQFSCPSCQRPIEVDDEWANSDVACPFCQKVVTTPAESTWAAGGQARPMTDDVVVAPLAPNVYGRWSLVFGITTIVIFFVMTAMIVAKAMPRIQELAKSGATAQEAQTEVLKVIENNPSLARAVKIGTVMQLFFSLSGTVLGVVGVTRQGLKRGTAVAGLIICGMFLLCQCPGAMMGVTGVVGG